MIRKATAEVSARLGEIHVLGWRYAYRGLVPDKYLFSKLTIEKRIDGFRKSIINNLEESYIYEDEDIVKAFMTIGKCRNEDRSECFELWCIYIDPVFKRNGIGKQLIKYCEERAREREFKEIVVWVFERNYDSRAFYEKMGYSFDSTIKDLEFYGLNEVRYMKIL